MDLPLSLNHEKLIIALDEKYSKIYIRSPKSPDFKLGRKEMYFRLGQRSVIDALLEELKQLKQKGES